MGAMILQSSDWRARFKALLPLYGHRNWIVIADSAYPAQVGALEVVATDEFHLPVVREVLSALRAAPHVRPTVWLDAELEYLSEDLATGAEATRADLLAALRDLSPGALPHAELLARVGKSAAEYRVLVLKTTGTVPYSSVFVQLDCGYWSAESEAALRERMAEV